MADKLGAPSDKKAVAIAALLTGETQEEAAKQSGLSQPTVSRLWSDLPEHLKERSLTVRHEEKQFEIQGLVQENLVESLKATTKIAQQAHDADWVKKQDAAQLATFYGVISDKTVRILGALERAHVEAERAARETREEFERARPGSSDSDTIVN